MRECYNIALSLWFVPAIITAFCCKFRESEQNKEWDAGKSGRSSRSKHSSATLQKLCDVVMALIQRLHITSLLQKITYWKVQGKAWNEGRYVFQLHTVRLKHTERVRKKRLHKASLVLKLLFEENRLSVRERERQESGGMEKIIHWNVWADLKWSGRARQPIRLSCLVLR